MAIVHIDLQEGFKNDTVVVRLGGEEVYRRDDVVTKLLYGLADSFAAEVGAGSVSMEVVVESRGLSLTLPLDVRSDLYVGLAVEGGEIRPILSETAFGYG